MKVTFGKLRDRLRGTGPIGTVRWPCSAFWRQAALRRVLARYRYMHSVTGISQCAVFLWTMPISRVQCNIPIDMEEQ